MKKTLFSLFLIFASFSKNNAQDTFSILAFDSITREVGAAGASCVDLFNYQITNHFICELFPGVGAIATQASYLTSNQINARNRMNLGDSPNQLISWLKANDVGLNSSVRQYGVVRMMHQNGMADSTQTAAFTGTNCMNYKNHLLGPNYSIHGNILSGKLVLDSMEARFNREKGDLACKLMAAMQGAKMVGADSRCAANGSSSLFAFLKVSPPTDTFDNPSFLVSLKTHANAGIEPIDSLQALFNAVKTCTLDDTGLNSNSENLAEHVTIYPNPSNHEVIIKLNNSKTIYDYKFLNSQGQIISQGSIQLEFILNTEKFNKGFYFIEIRNGQKSFTRKIILN